MDAATRNPLLAGALPDFGGVEPEHVGPALDGLLHDAEAALERATSDAVPADYDALSAVLDVATERLGVEHAGEQRTERLHAAVR